MSKSEDLPLFLKLQARPAEGVHLTQPEELAYKLDKKGEMPGKYLKKT